MTRRNIGRSVLGGGGAGSEAGRVGTILREPGLQALETELGRTPLPGGQVTWVPARALQCAAALTMDAPSHSSGSPESKRENGWEAAQGTHNGCASHQLPRKP